MLRKVLTHIIIMALTVLPVQVISAGIENSNMQMHMKMDQVESDCMHKLSADPAAEKSCCNEHSNQCKSCNNCPQVTSAMVLSVEYQAALPSFKKQTIFSSHLLLNGIPQNNPIKPPRTTV